MTTGGGDGEIQTEIVKAALLRGRMCESVGDVVRTSRNRDIPAGGSLLLLGLFSDIKMLLGVPVSEILEDIDVTDAVRDAILDHEGPGGTILAAVEGYMEADWDRAEGGIGRLGADVSTLFDIYVDSIAWAGDRMAYHKDAA